MKITLFESNKSLNPSNSNLSNLTNILNFENTPNANNCINDNKLFNEPSSHKINFLTQTQENNYIQNKNQNILLNINNNNDIKNNNDNLNYKSEILYKFPQCFHDNKGNKIQNNQIKNNNNEIAESNINNIKGNNDNQNNILFNLKDYMFNYNNNSILNELNQHYNNILFNSILDFKNNYYNSKNIFSNYSNCPINQENNISINNNRNLDDFINNNFLSKKVMFKNQLYL